MIVAITSNTLSNSDDFAADVATVFNIPFENVRRNFRNSLKGSDLQFFLYDADYVVLGTEIMDAKLINSLPKMKCIFKYGVGLDNVDLNALAKKNIPIFFKKGTNSNAVAEICLAYSILLLRNQPISNTLAKNGNWLKTVGRELNECTFGIIGLGHVGTQFATLLKNLGVNNIIAFDKNNVLENANLCNAKLVSLNELLSYSDVVSIHIDNEKRINDNFFNEDCFKKMKEGSIFINSSRGSVVDYNALNRYMNKLSGIGIDVYPDEPNIPQFLTKNENTLLSCHICGSSKKALTTGSDFLISSMKEYIRKQKM